MGDCGNPFGRAQPAYARRRVDQPVPSDRPDDRASVDRARLGLALLLILAAVAMLVAAPRAHAQTAPCADLVIDAVNVTPTPPVLGQSSTIDVTVRNAGTCAAGAFTVDWRPSLFAPTGPSASVPGLAVGASTVVNLPYVFPQLGLALTFARVDTTNAVPEIHEGNNTFFRFISVPPTVDLVVTNLSVTPPLPVVGQQATVSITVANQGSSPAGAFRVDFSPAFLAPGIPSQVAGLAGGTSTTLTVPYTWTNAGAFDTTATVDAGSAVAESDEFNNSRSLRVTAAQALPDLVITDAVVDPSPTFAGSSVTATITVTNQGITNAGNFTVRWQPWLLGSPVSTQVNGLNAGASTTVTLSSVFSATGIFAGTATADSTGAVAEINEGNNTRTTTVTVTPPTLEAHKIATGGFGDSENSYSWSMAWFKGKLYVGTARSVHCVETLTLEFYFPGEGYYRGEKDGLPEAVCPPDPYDLDLRAGIWQYTPESSTWRRVYQSPTVPNPRAPGKSVALEIGYRGMAVFTDSQGVEALYVGGVTANEFIPELAETHPPRVLRSVDGETFTPLPTGPGIIRNTFGEQRPMGFRAMVVYDGRLFVTATGGLTGDGVVMEVQNPSGPSPTWVQVSPETLQVYEMEAFNGSLYIGTGLNTTGYAVWKLTNPSTIPFGFTQVVPFGAGRGTAITSVVSMHVFKGRMYVGANGWGAGSQPAAEEIRVNPDDTWDVVVGAPRTLTDGTTKSPISGLGDGFGNFFNAHMWRAETHNGAMYIGTNDASSAFRLIPALGPLLAPEFGFDVWGTCDGQYWWQVTRNAFGDGQWNFGARTLASSPFGLFIGSTNHVEGLSAWNGDASPCGAGATFGPVKRAAAPGASGGSAQPASLPAPSRLLANAESCGNVLTWDAAPGARQYRIMRSEYRTADVSLEMPVTVPGEFTMPAPASTGGTAAKRQRVQIAGPYAVIGSTTKTSFVDRTAKPGTHYNYEVVAVGARRQVSQASNVATMPSEMAKATFVRLNAAIRRLGADEQRLLSLAGTARTTWTSTGPSASLKILGQLRTAVDGGARGASNAAAISDVRDAIFRLERRARVNAVCGR
jgi:subtilase family serine protease